MIPPELITRMKNLDYQTGYEEGRSSMQADYHFALDETKFADLMQDIDWGAKEVAEYIKNLEQPTQQQEK